MARCYKCEQEIGFYQMMKAAYKHLGRNFRRRTLIVFNCPHCDIECQETALTYYSFIVLYVGAFFGAMVYFQFTSIENFRGFLIFLGTYIVAGYLWWKFFAILKEPHHFFWE